MQGQYEDSETGLYYNRYRYFDANICAYVSQDPLGLLAGSNTYSYPFNPLRYTDPLGLKCPELSGGEEPKTTTKTHEHHSDPKFMGGDPNQKLTTLEIEDHKGLHKDMNNFLDTKVNEAGKSMRPKRGNSGKVIQRNFTREERLNALAEFYKGDGAKYTNAVNDFFAQHPTLK